MYEMVKDIYDERVHSTGRMDCFGSLLTAISEMFEFSTISSSCLSLIAQEKANVREST
jgi:hypothetical protein